MIKVHTRNYKYEFFQKHYLKHKHYINYYYEAIQHNLTPTYEASKI